MSETSSPLRFGALLLPNVAWQELVRRAREAEMLGLDFVWLDDHIVHPGKPDMAWFEVWTALAGLAGLTTRVRIGPLVSNIVLRHPVVLARQAHSVEHISNGRLEIGLGAGYAPTDHIAVGVAEWPPAERAQRFADAVALIDNLLRGGPVTNDSAFYRVESLTLAPAPLVRPRPPLAVAAHGPSSLGVAARHADTWVSFGGFGLSPDEQVALLRERTARLEAAATAAGRDPASIARRVLAGSAALTKEPIWRSVGAFEDFVGRYRELGVREFAFHYPPSAVNPDGAVDADVVERIMLETIPALRG